MIRKFESKQEECLVILMEECGELIQECSKMIRKNDYKSFDFIKEVGDVICLINLAHGLNMFNYEDVDNREEEKLKKLKKWSNLVD